MCNIDVVHAHDSFGIMTLNNTTMSIIGKLPGVVLRIHRARQSPHQQSIHHLQSLDRHYQARGLLDLNSSLWVHH